MSVLVIAPHMDDEVLGCGGLIQRFEDVHVLFITESPVDHRLRPDGQYEAYTGIERGKEMQAAAELLGYSYQQLRFDVHTLDRVPLADLIRHLEVHLDGIELLLGPGPSHDEDHRVVRRAVDALKRPHCYAGSVLEYFTWGCAAPYNDALLLPLKVKEMETKLDALSFYETQLAPGGMEDQLYLYSRANVLAYGQVAGTLCHTPYAEVFEPRRLVPNEATSRLLCPSP